ncbi:MAG: iron ABC transporter permease [Draconibacterium sp.]|nr:MAG: iron ABC transporter permease [Draconibacterium sp.]
MRQKYILGVFFLVALVFLLIIAIIISLSSGEVKIPVIKIPEILNNKGGIEYTVLSKIRLPRMVLAIATGGALSLSGAILQGIYRNPLVEPYTLGISGGAALGVALAVVIGVAATGYFMLPLFGFIGAVLTLFLVYSLSMRKEGLRINHMLLVGVMVSFVSSSAMMFILSTTTSDNLQNIIFWVMGSLDESNSLLIKIMFWSSVAGLLLAYLFARPLNALRLGETKAKHLGINTGTTITILFFTASLLTGVAVSVTGVIGFVGLVIPHVVRLLVDNDYRILLIGSYLGGAIFLIFCDTLARTIISPNELPIGVITGIAGGLVFIGVLSRSKSKFKMN